MSNEHVHISDRRQHGFAMVGYDVIDLGLPPAVGWTYVVLVRFVGYRADRAPLSRALLAQAVGCTVPSLDKYLAQLEKAGLIAIESGKDNGAPNTYVLLDLESGPDAAPTNDENTSAGVLKNSGQGYPKKHSTPTQKNAVPPREEPPPIENGKKKRRAPKDARLFEVIAFYSFGVKPGEQYGKDTRGRTNRILRELRETFDPLPAPRDVVNAYRWHMARGLYAPADSVAVVRMINGWRRAGAPNYRARHVNANGARDLSPEDIARMRAEQEAAPGIKPPRARLDEYGHALSQ